MALDLNAIAAQAAKAGGGEAKSVGALPDNVDDYIAQLVDDEVLNIGQATALRLLVGKAKVEVVTEAVRRASESVEAAAVDAEVVSEDVVEDQAPEELEAAARAFDEEIERRRTEAGTTNVDEDGAERGGGWG